MKKLILIIIVLILFVSGIVGVRWYQTQQKMQAINSFEECAKSFPVMESYPGRCVTSDGRSFTQDIGNELEYTDEILIETPRPNQTITSSFRIAGQARGSWYFEADFPVELVDGNNKSLAISHAQAQGEWMTSEFVPFEGKIIFQKPTTQSGTLIIRNANPSGLAENQKELRIPVMFE